MGRDTVRIAGASGGWGDSPRSIAQLLGASPDYLIMDYLAEVTMSLLARARLKDPEAGFVPDFVTFLAPHLSQLDGVRIVTNAGGINPLACRAALRAACEMAGVALRIAVVEGDDVMRHLGAIPGAGHLQDLLSANAYLGALPIAAALDRGADIVITGRCVDSALTLGILMSEFGWRSNDHDRLAAGSLAGHILECGPQATGGTFTDWRDVPDLENIGYPFADCRADGSFVVGKPERTGGLVTPAVIAEQILYEVDDPRSYVLPDVTADFSRVTVRQEGPNRVAVKGARGAPPTPRYKISATYQDGYRLVGLLPIVGVDATAKAERTARALIGRAERLLAELKQPALTGTHVEVLGSEASYGSGARRRDTREVVLRLVVTHPSRESLDLFAREFSSMGLAGSPGTTGVIGGRARAAPLIRLRTLFVDKASLPPPRVQIDDEPWFNVGIVPGVDPGATVAASPPIPWPTPESQDAQDQVPLSRIAHARSGDKGDDSNIALFARTPELVEILRREVTEARVAAWFAEELRGSVHRYEAPGLHAFNFVLTGVLGGGGMASDRIDPQGKSFGQRLLEMLVLVPEGLLEAPGAVG